MSERELPEGLENLKGLPYEVISPESYDTAGDLQLYGDIFDDETLALARRIAEKYSGNTN